MDRWFRVAIHQALKANGKYKVGAVCLDRRGRLLSTASNSHKTHPVQAKYAERGGSPRKQCLHAEMRALLRANGNVNTVLVARVNRKGEMRMARPCETICMPALEEKEVECVWYTTNEGWRYELCER